MTKELTELKKEFMEKFGLDEEEMLESQVFDGIVLWNFFEPHLSHDEIKREAVLNFIQFYFDNPDILDIDDVGRRYLQSVDKGDKDER